MPPNSTVVRLTKSPVSSLAFVLPIIVFFVLTVLGCHPLLAAGIALVFCVVGHNLAYTGQEIDPIRGVQRTYYTVLGQSFGNWEALSPIIGITLKYFSSLARNNTPQSRSNWGIWNNAQKRTEEIIVMLSIAKSSTGITLQTFPIDRLQTALVYAQDLADQLSVPLNTFLPAHVTVQEH